jgi:hypothetical protein
MGLCTLWLKLLSILDSRLLAIKEYDVLLHISKKGDEALLTSITSKRSVDT